MSFQVKKGELLGLIGPNGAGKSSVFNLVTGIYSPTSGEILFEGEVCSGLRASEVTAMGMARTFQNVRLFHSLSVLENVVVAFNLHLSHSWLHAITRGAKFLQEEANVRQQALELLKIFGLDQAGERLATALSYGSQRRLEIVRAMATQPKLLLLDEPAAGMKQVIEYVVVDRGRLPHGRLLTWTSWCPPRGPARRCGSWAQRVDQAALPSIW